MINTKGKPLSKAEFTFPLGATVTIEASGESGTVVARADYEHAEDSYLVRYKAGDGRAVEAWWTEGALKIAE